ncbi:MAG: hypothetical protein IJ258_06875 [Methanobrevibacter sp.]|uniref:hypothetical protein n=1 Tax=Methanobrevibacter sp. TaxID=66852 RepID=UPI0025F1955B|nr:hypothetical protein [Methanobrevibacter sp.]MBQ8017814.1 hypothetical protein [Methanobrevibacter sp.]
MSDDFLKDLFEIREDTTFEFKEICGFTFAFMTKTTLIKDKISAYEIIPIGIIYTENDEYYFAPLDRVDYIDDVIEEYVKIASKIKY